MKKRIFGLLTLIFLLISVFSLVACSDGKSDDKEDLTVTDSVFSSFSAEDYYGDIVDQTILAECRVTMINVWGTFCEPCKKELPELSELNAEYADKGFQVIGVPVDSSLSTAVGAKEMIEELNADFRHLKVSSSLKKFVSGIKSVPYTIFVNENGEQIGKGYSGSKSKADWKKIIDEMLDFVSG